MTHSSNRKFQEKTLQNLEVGIHYKFTQVKLLIQALTHSSYANEHNESDHYERLEFLGDAVLELCITRHLFLRFPDADEGVLTKLRSKLVNERSLAELGKKHGIDSLMLLGKGEEKQGGRSRNALISDIVEALLGAIFLDGGFSAVTDVVEHLFEEKWPQDDALSPQKDFKSKLQEYTQKKFQDRPVYTMLGSSGPEHAKQYTVEVKLPDGSVFLAEESSLKKAEQQAAQQALTNVQKTS